MMTKEMRIDTVVEHACLLGEGPVWDAKRSVICWVDILKGEIHQFSTENKSHKIIPVYENIGAISICKDGNFLAALKNGFAFINRENGLIEMIADNSLKGPRNRSSALESESGRIK